MGPGAAVADVAEVGVQRRDRLLPGAEEPEQDQKKRGALGVHVWRMADGSDGMYEEEQSLPHGMHLFIL